MLDRSVLRTSHSLAAARVIFELAQRDRWERMELREFLQIDDSYLTRILARLADKKLVAHTASDIDGRRKTVALTGKGRAEYETLDARSTEEAKQLLSSLTNDQRRTLGEAMTIIPRLVHPGCEQGSVAIRSLGSGDLGWVIKRHGEIYSDEFGWNADFEALVARIVADFHSNHKPGREDAWMADVDGARAGCIFCCEKDNDSAQLRILLVEPWARGLGIGTELVKRCVEFARNARYRRLMLWTNDVLVSARRIYEAAGFRLLDEQTHRSFGHDLTGQNWQLELSGDAGRAHRNS